MQFDNSEKLRPLVSVYIPTHNRAHLVERAVLSVINQTYPRVEIIIVDDGSTDETPEVLDMLSYQYSNITVLRHEEAKGACAARNLAIDNSKGDFITGLDDDDEFYEHRINDFVQNYNSDYSFLCTTYVQQSDIGEIKSIFKQKVISFEDMKNRNHVVGHVFIKRSLLNRRFRFFEKMPAWQDYDLYFRIVKEFGPACMINNHSYKAHLSGVGERISGSPSAHMGFRMFIERHQQDLSLKQIRNHRINDLYNRRVKLSIVESFCSVKSVYSAKKLSLLFLLTRWPKLYFYLANLVFKQG